MQTKLIYTLAGQELRASRARNLVASLAGSGIELPDALFHYRDGSPITRAVGDASPKEHLRQAFPLIRFAGVGETLSIIGVGEDASSLLKEHAMVIRAGLAKVTGTKPVMRIETDTVQIGRSQAFHQYTLHHPILLKKAKTFKRLQAAGAEGYRAHIAEHIARGIELQCDMLALDMPEDLEIQVREVDLDQLFGYSLLDDAQRAAAPGAAKALGQGIRRVNFHMRATLRGHWVAGHLVSRGFGRISRAHERLTVVAGAGA
jgi:hypothetical protein